MIEFKKWPKIPRFENEEWFITEKIDGTNACVIITKDGQVAAQSRTQIITVNNDNFGFAKWVEDHKEELKELGVGYHYGEWWGKGIQRNYGLEERRFTLFNPNVDDKYPTPQCVSRVPLLGLNCINYCLEKLRSEGSQIVKGFMDPEGIVIHSKLIGVYYKVLLNKKDNRDEIES